MLNRLAKCKLPNQPNKVAHEPRKARGKPRVYPALKGDRASARQIHLLEMADAAKS